MSIFDLVKNAIGKPQQDEEKLVGMIVEGPKRIDNGDSSQEVLTFRLDSRPDLVFRQEVRPLAPDRKRGDQVRVHYRILEDGTANVEWIESAA